VTQPAGSGSGGELPAAIVACVTVIVVAIIGGVVFLTYQGKSLEGFLTVMAAVVIPSVTALLAIRSSRQVSDVQSKVDGKIDNLITDKSNLEQQIALHGIMPVTAKVSYDPDTTGPIPRISTDTSPMPAAKHAAPPTGEVRAQNG